MNERKQNMFWTKEKRTRAQPKTRWEKDTKENRQWETVGSVGATGKARLCSTIIKYSVVDCLDVSTCSYVFILEKLFKKIEASTIQRNTFRKFSTCSDLDTFFSCEFFFEILDLIVWFDDNRRDKISCFVIFPVCVFVLL